MPTKYWINLGIVFLADEVCMGYCIHVLTLIHLNSQAVLNWLILCFLQSFFLYLYLNKEKIINQSECINPSDRTNYPKGKGHIRKSYEQIWQLTQICETLTSLEFHVPKADLFTF